MLQLKSSKQKIVIVSDPHNDYKKLNNIIHKEGGDINICLGDWFDSFYLDDPTHYTETAEYLKNVFLPNSHNYTLFGNHDIHYLFDGSVTQCSGFESWKYKAIDTVFNKDRSALQNKFHWFIVVDDILLTHAGLDNRHISPVCSTENHIFQYLEKASQDANVKIKINQNHWFYEAGFSRGGTLTTGGILWCDFDEEFEPIEGLKQIVGHTNQYRTGRAKQHYTEGYGNIVDANNICIDCDLNQYITITDGKLELKNYSDL